MTKLSSINLFQPVDEIEIDQLARRGPMVYGTHLYISLSDHVKLASPLGFHKLSNIYVLLVELILKWTVV